MYFQFQNFERLKQSI